jgi:predicted DNA-binding transcriptional regulator AlpA
MAEPKLLTIDDIAQLAGVTRRAVIDWVSKKWIQPRDYHKRPGKQGAAISLFDPADVDELLRRRVAAKTQVLPADAPGPVVRSTMAVVPTSAAVVPTSEEPKPAVVPLPIDHKRYLTLDQAVEYTGLGKAYIREHATGWPIGPHRSTVFRRADLDKL